MAGCPRGGDEPRIALARSRPHRRRQRGRRPPREHRPAGHRHARSAAGRTAARARPSRSIRPTSARKPSARCACRSPARTTSSRSRSCGSACPAAAAASCRASSPARPRRRCSTAAVGLRGTSLVRFLGWATAGAPDLRRQGRRHVRRPLAAVDRGRTRRRPQYRRRPLGHGDLRRRAIPLGGPAGAVRQPRRPAARRARLHPGRIEPGRHLRRGPAWAAA